MAASSAVSFDELRARVDEMAKDAAYEEAERDRAINRGLKRLYDRLVIARGEEYYAKEATITAIVGQAKYEEDDGFPINFYRLRKVVAFDGSSYRDLDPWDYDMLSALLTLQLSGSSGFTLYRYKLVQGGIEIRPQPQTIQHSFILTYVPSMPTLVEDEDSFDGVNGWEDWAVYSAAIDLLNEDESFEQSAALAGQRALMEADIVALAGSRDQGAPAEVQDLRRDRYMRHRRWRSYSEEG